MKERVREGERVRVTEFELGFCRPAERRLRSLHFLTRLVMFSFVSFRCMDLLLFFVVLEFSVES